MDWYYLHTEWEREQVRHEMQAAGLESLQEGLVDAVVAVAAAVVVVGDLQTTPSGVRLQAMPTLYLALEKLDAAVSLVK